MARTKGVGEKGFLGQKVFSQEMFRTKGARDKRTYGTRHTSLLFISVRKVDLVAVRGTGFVDAARQTIETYC